MRVCLGNWEFLSQTNDNAECVPGDDRFRFVDNLMTLEVINLLTVGLSSFYMKSQVPSDIPVDGQFIDGSKLKSQQYLDQINKWTDDHKMVILEKKTKAMIFNFTDNYKFTTRIGLKGRNIEIVDKMKILGTIVDSKLSWDDNCSMIIKKVNARMQLIRSLQSFGATTQEMVHIWILFCRSILEQSCVVWGTSLTQENKDDLERTQKTFAKLILREKYKNYDNALLLLNLDTLEKRRQDLCLKFAKGGIKSEKLCELFPMNDKKHIMQTRDDERFQVKFANTDRLKHSSIITMQNMLNDDAKRTT